MGKRVPEPTGNNSGGELSLVSLDPELICGIGKA
jgi:hypothetical protein